MSEEEKGFVIKDRRSFDEEGGHRESQESPAEEQPKTPDREATTEDTKKEARAEAREQETTSTPLPEVNFSSLILSLSSSSLFHLGEVPDPQTGEKKRDLALAKHAIDTISMLKEKTEGNLSEEEQKFVESVLTDLRWRYVKAK